MNKLSNRNNDDTSLPIILQIHMNAIQYVFCVHTQQAMELHPKMMYRYARDLRSTI
jgi:hypothetical protein